MQSARWYLNRLSVMSASEIAARLIRRQRLLAERMGLFRAGHPSDSTWSESDPQLRYSVPQSIDPSRYVAAAEEVAAGTFEFFGRRFELGRTPQWNVDPSTGTIAPLDFGKTLDYRDNGVVGDIKFLWELNRHLELVALAQAFALTGEERYVTVLRESIWSWIRQCPYPLGPNWCSSLELGIRLINWHLAYSISGGSASPLFSGPDGERFRRDWSIAIHRHVHFIMGHLSTHSSANNHRIGEAAGVFVAASTWPFDERMEGWRYRAREILCEEIATQTYPDGVNKEQAISYQQFVLYFFIIAGLTGERRGEPLPSSYWQAVARMLTFVSSLMDAGGNVPMIGDADDGVVYALEPRRTFEPYRSVLAIGGRLFDHPGWRRQSVGHEDTASWLNVEPSHGIELNESSRGPSSAFPQGGYYLLGSRLGEPDEVRVTVDAGPLGYLGIAAHGHADALALCVSVGGREQLIDPGTYCYHTEKAWRDYFRGTAAHNTVRVDGEDQSEIGGPFLWLQKAAVQVDEFERGETIDFLRARHTGYERLRDPVIHRREIRLDKTSLVLQVTDRIECASAHRVERFWHFAEGCAVEPVEGGVLSIDGDVALSLRSGEPDTQVVIFEGSSEPIAGWVSRRFGQKEPTTTVVFRNSLTTSAELGTTIAIQR